MKRKFVVVSGMKKIYFKYENGEKLCFKMWECFEAWLITKEPDNSRRIDFKQLLKMRALTEFTLG